jgi:hypothetical protein
MGRFSEIRIRNGGGKVCFVCVSFLCVCFLWIAMSNNSQGPEEEHTTCSGGPTINCHKRGLRGERIF